ncbi:hypothetical protein C5167_011850 [Papaver somniferum]|uniref:RNase H type-1 domain-containing protein n=1 Tax=Papaver somniferum TaxID=3469 RepID=A0A4Y7IZR8_PAPSO|nr:uncharacterized protein LOC113355118 [Papaver somniferum]RZC52998.1 hypothetical protein C5167_011850 [Papaver somniferum]
MSTSYLTTANEDLKINDLHTYGPAATANISICPPKSKQQIQEEEEVDDDYDSISDSSLSDYHAEEYPITATSESEDNDSESEDSDYRSRIELKQSSITATIQSLSYPNKRKKGEKNTRSEDNIEAKDRSCKAKEPSKFRPRSNLLSKYVSWSGKPSDCQCDTLEKERWVESWFLKSEKDRKGYHYLNIYGFYKKVTGVGGYGVILRDPCGKPVVASASVQQNGKSYFYHVLDGVKAGLALALEHNIYDLKLRCNSETLAGCLRQIFQQADAGLFKTRRTRNRFARYRCGACKTCLSVAIPLDDERLDILFPLLKEIIDMHIKIMSKSHYFFLNYASRGVNKAAYHLAKQLSKEMKTATESKTNKTIRPIDVGEDLKMILFEDACVGARWYSQHL